MAKSLAASKKLMQNYLSELLTEEESTDVTSVTIPEVETKEKNLEKLLQSVTVSDKVADPITEPVVTEKAKATPADKVVAKKPVIAPPVIKPDIEDKPLETRKSVDTLAIKAEKNYRKGSFQAMFFDVAGLIVAVPLIELGGIHNSEKTTALMGKPDWFTGVMLYRDEKINVVNTALWVMPEKCDDALTESLNYKYIIMLSNSRWGLSAENLVDTVTLEQDDVKWLDKPSKRPWLAGLVKNRMCALLDVEALVKMLDEGANIAQD